MDNLRGNPGAFDEPQDETSWNESDTDGELSVDDTPPHQVGQDERRMQVRAYNYWVGLLGDRTFPSVADIDTDTLPDFSDNSVLLDFTGSTENPAIAFLGEKLAAESPSEQPIRTLADVPSRSLLSRITDHYLQILANEAPIGFEAEFVNDSGATVLYRGILLPFSSDDETIDFIYGVINWKEVADQLTTDALMHEIDKALDGSASQRDDDELPAPERRLTSSPSITRWADGPGTPDDQAYVHERTLAALPAQPIDAIPVEGAEFSICVIRRDADGAVAFLGEVADDERLLARAAKHLTAAAR